MENPLLRDLWVPLNSKLFSRCKKWFHMIFCLKSWGRSSEVKNINMKFCWDASQLRHEPFCKKSVELSKVVWLNSYVRESLNVWYEEVTLYRRNQKKSDRYKNRTLEIVVVYYVVHILLIKIRPHLLEWKGLLKHHQAYLQQRYSQVFTERLLLSGTDTCGEASSSCYLMNCHLYLQDTKTRPCNFWSWQSRVTRFEAYYNQRGRRRFGYSSPPLPNSSPCHGALIVKDLCVVKIFVFWNFFLISTKIMHKC